MANSNPELLKAKEAGDLLGVSHESIRRWAEKNKLACIVLPSGARRYRRSDIEAILRGDKPDTAAS